VQHDQLTHQGLLEQRLDRLRRHIENLSEEVASVEALKTTSPLPSAGALGELGHSLRAEILRLQHELDACEAELWLSRDQLTENQQPADR